MKSYTRQQGHAAILFAILIPALFGIFILGTDGARALQGKARLEEAAEVAALAIAGQSGTSEDARDETASNYISYYFPYSEVTDIATQDIACEDNSECDENAAASERFFQYTVSATISQPNWFSKDSIKTSFGDDVTIGGYSSARKYQSKTVDVVLVADFSSSMENTTANSSNAKYVDLENIITDVAATIESYNEKSSTQHSTAKNTMAFVGFNYFTYENTSVTVTKRLNGESDTNTGYPKYDYIMCKNGKKNSSGALHPYNDGWCGLVSNGVPDGDIDYQMTVDNIFNEDAFLPTTFINPNKANKMLDSHLDLKFHNIASTSDVTALSETTSTFVPQGQTAFYTGLIKGAQVASQGTNSRRLIILLSDGHNTSDTITDNLIDAGLCSTITDTLNEQTTSSGESVKATMYAIGFGYSASEYPEMGECVGDDNVYDATDSDSIKNKILELIAEEMGRLSPSN